MKTLNYYLFRLQLDFERGTECLQNFKFGFQFDDNDGYNRDRNPKAEYTEQHELELFE